MKQKNDSEVTPFFSTSGVRGILAQPRLRFPNLGARLPWVRLASLRSRTYAPASSRRMFPYF